MRCCCVTVETDRNDVMPCKVEAAKLPLPPKQICQLPFSTTARTSPNPLLTQRSLMFFLHRTKPLPRLFANRPVKCHSNLRHQKTLLKLLCRNPRALVGFLVTRQLIVSLETIFAAVFAPGNIAGKVIGYQAVRCLVVAW